MAHPDPSPFPVSTSATSVPWDWERLTTVRRAPRGKQGWKEMSWGWAPRSPRTKPLWGEGTAEVMDGKTPHSQGTGDVWDLTGCTGKGQPKAKGVKWGGDSVAKAHLGVKQ